MHVCINKYCLDPLRVPAASSLVQTLQLHDAVQRQGELQVIQRMSNVAVAEQLSGLGLGPCFLAITFTVASLSLVVVQLSF